MNVKYNNPLTSFLSKEERGRFRKVLILLTIGYQDRVPNRLLALFQNIKNDFGIIRVIN